MPVEVKMQVMIFRPDRDRRVFLYVTVLADMDQYTGFS